MRRFVHGLSLGMVALGLIGCGADRSPHLVIAPSYSYVQADLAAGVPADPNAVEVVTTEVSLTSAANKLPPIPAAPGFDTYVLVPAE